MEDGEFAAGHEAPTSDFPGQESTRKWDPRADAPGQVSDSSHSRDRGVRFAAYVGILNHHGLDSPD
jgi:hypothetical protein